MVRKVNSLNNALFSSSCPSRENYCLIFAFSPPHIMHFWAFFFLIAGKNIYHPTNLYLKRNRNDHVKFASVQTFHLCV